MNRILALLLCISTFIYGILVGTYQFPPYETLKEVQDIIFDDRARKARADAEAEAERDAEAKMEAKLSAKILELMANVKDTNKLTNLREKLLSKIIDNSNPGYVSAKDSDEGKILQTSYYGITSKALLSIANEPKSCLRIYIQGHGGNPLDFDYHNKLKILFLEDGCDVLSMSMLGIGVNEGEASFPTRYGLIELNKEVAKNHEKYADFFDEDNPDLDPLSLFLYPHYKLIKSVINEYDDVALMGISGGGWYTVWLSSLIPEVRTSISYAGSLPMPYREWLPRLGEGIDPERYTDGDWEMYSSRLYSEVGYIDLYQLMALDGKGEFSRKATLVYKDNDVCCWRNPWAAHFKHYSYRHSFLRYNVFIDEDESGAHEMNVELVLRLLNQP